MLKSNPHAFHIALDTENNMIISEVQSCLQARTCPIIAETEVAQQDLHYQGQQQELYP